MALQVDVLAAVLASLAVDTLGAGRVGILGCLKGTLGLLVGTELRLVVHEASHYVALHDLCRLEVAARGN